MMPTLQGVKHHEQEQRVLKVKTVMVEVLDVVLFRVCVRSTTKQEQAWIYISMLSVDSIRPESICPDTIHTSSAVVGVVEFSSV